MLLHIVLSGIHNIVKPINNNGHFSISLNTKLYADEVYSFGDFVFDRRDERLYFITKDAITSGKALHVPVTLVESLDAGLFNHLMTILASVWEGSETQHIAADAFLVLALRDFGTFEEGLAVFEKIAKMYA